MKKMMLTAAMATTLALGAAPAHAATSGATGFTWEGLWSQIGLILPALQNPCRAQSC